MGDDQLFRHVLPLGQLRDGVSPEGLRSAAAIEKNSGVVYLLLGATSRRFRGNSAVLPALAWVLPANSRQEWQIQKRTGILSLPAFPVKWHWSAAVATRRTSDLGVGLGNRAVLAAWNRTVERLALAGNGDVVAASRMAAILARFRNRAGDFVRIDPAVGSGLREIP